MRIKFVILSLLTGMFILNVNAEESIYYTNSQNVNFTIKEYEFISNMFYKGYQDSMSLNDYEEIFWDKNIVDSEIQKNTTDESLVLMPYGVSHETASKKLTIAKVCTSECLITLNAVWKKSPYIRSYDVIGVRLIGVNLTRQPTTNAIGTSQNNSSNEIVQYGNGFGVSVKLPTSGSDMTVAQYFRVTTGGSIYGSYQHAKSSITLTNSKKYSISSSGYGGVFLFDNSVKASYDAMAGVSISV